MRISRGSPLPLLLLLAASVGRAGEAPPLRDPYSFHSQEIHSVRLIDRAAAGLEERLRMIARARRSIDIEYFYFEPDRAGRLLLQALVEKSRTSPEVSVRILLDSWGSEGFSAEQAAVLGRSGIAVKRFNVVSPLRFARYNHRDHRKLLIIDKSELLTGGPNVAVEHLGLSEEYNHLDREVLVKGPVAVAAARTFEDFWKRRWSEWAVLPGQVLSERDCDIRDEDCLRRWREARNALLPTREDLAARESLRLLVDQQPDREFLVQDIRFVSDRAGMREEDRKLTPLLNEILSSLTSSLVIEGTHFIPGSSRMPRYKELLARGVRMTVLTNSMLSISSWDLSPMTLSLPYQQELAALGAEIQGLAGPNHLLEQTFHTPALRTVWGTHAKTAVFDESLTFIGTYNFDPRSENLNVEDGVLIRSPEFASAVAASIGRRIQAQALPLHPDGTYGNGDALSRALSGWQQLHLGLLRIFRHCAEIFY